MSAPTLRWLVRARDAAAPSRIGVLSGTFNPPTRAHLALAQRAVEALVLEHVIFVLPEVPPHKGALEASLADRAEMLRRAVAGQPQFSAAVVPRGLFLEIHRALELHLPRGTRFFFLAGRDAAQRILLDWPYDDAAQALAQMFGRFEFVVAARGAPFAVPADSLAARYADKIHHLHLPPDEQAISATAIRECVARDEPIDHLVPASVADYIREKKLYV